MVFKNLTGQRMKCEVQFPKLDGIFFWEPFFPKYSRDEKLHRDLKKLSLSWIR